MPRTFGKRGLACARLEGLILRRPRPSRRRLRRLLRARRGRLEGLPPRLRYRIYTSHDSESQTQEKPLIFGHFPHSATRKGQFGVSRCFDSSLAICVDTVARRRGDGGGGEPARVFVH